MGDTAIPHRHPSWCTLLKSPIGDLRRPGIGGPRSRRRGARGRGGSGQRGRRRLDSLPVWGNPYFADPPGVRSPRPVIPAGSHPGKPRTWDSGAPSGDFGWREAPKPAATGIVATRGYDAARGGGHRVDAQGSGAGYSFFSLLTRRPRRKLMARGGSIGKAAANARTR